MVCRLARQCQERPRRRRHRVCPGQDGVLLLLRTYLRWAGEAGPRGPRISGLCGPWQWQRPRQDDPFVHRQVRNQPGHTHRCGGRGIGQGVPPAGPLRRRDGPGGLRDRRPPRGAAQGPSGPVGGLPAADQDEAGGAGRVPARPRTVAGVGPHQPGQHPLPRGSEGLVQLWLQGRDDHGVHSRKDGDCRLFRDGQGLPPESGPLLARSGLHVQL
mmetsp:Transcript_57551/g.102809  ORF Transcript_57551/g.102809 Transcript_57551/m.102809 type:complete len:214 (+) Transcript_57551:1402-2043(+)